MKIEWRDVLGWEGWYQVSNFGSVRRIKAGRGIRVGRVLKNAKNTPGYHYVNLCRDGIVKPRLVHQLVLEAFGPSKPSPDHEVNHKNGIKTDNRIENLEWITRSENQKHAYTIGLKNQDGERHPRAKLNDVKVRSIRKRLSEGETQNSLAEEFLVSIQTISRIGNYRRWKHI